jgi:hypothetical protein
MLSQGNASTPWCVHNDLFYIKQLIVLHLPIAHLRSRILRKPISLLSLSQNIARIYQVGRAEISKYRNLTLALFTISDSDGKITYKRKSKSYRGYGGDNTKINELFQARDGVARWTG